jgi:hypothetical protein
VQPAPRAVAASLSQSRSSVQPGHRGMPRQCDPGTPVASVPHVSAIAGARTAALLNYLEPEKIMSTAMMSILREFGAEII